MADSFIYRLNESTVIKTDDYTLFDIVDIETGDYYTKKVSYGTLVKQLTSGIINDVQSKLNTLQSTLNLANAEILKKLDKNGLEFSSSEIITGILSINNRLSVFDVADFNKDIDLHKNKIKNLAEPTDDSDAVNKKYIDDKFSTLNIPNLGNYLLKNGDTMDGFLTLPSTTPYEDYHAATKKYVDDKLPSNTYLPISGGTLTGNLIVLTPTSDNHPATKKYVDDRIITTGEYLPLSGGTMIGNLSVIHPSLDNHAATKKYVDGKVPNINIYLPLSGGTMTGDLFVAENPVNDSQVANKAYVDSKSIGNLYLPLSGGNMTGALSVLDPTLPLQAVNKKYADAFNPSGKYVLNSGGTMTGTLVLSGYTETLQSFDFGTAGALTINCATGNYNNNILLNLNANITHFDFINIAPTTNLKTYTFTFFIRQKGNIPNFYDITWQVLTAVGGYTNVKWASGTYTAGGPNITKLYDAVDIISLSRINGEWYGFSSGQNF
jgi:hypothetical protein